jgi:guanine deaminase
LDFLQTAIDLAIENTTSNRGGPYGAVVVKEGEIIAQGTNLVTATIDPTAHAEILAIRQACQKLNHFQLHGCVLYTSCEPCPMCLGAIYWAAMKMVVYASTRQDAAQAGFDDNYIYGELVLAPAARSIPMQHCKNPHALQPFAAWRQQADRIEY